MKKRLKKRISKKSKEISISQLKKELDKLKLDKKRKDLMIKKQKKELEQRKNIEKEIKELRRSPGYKKKKVTKENIKYLGKITKKGTIKGWELLGKAVRKLDKIQI